MHDLSGSQESDRVDDVRIVTEAEDIIIGRSRLLLRRHRLMQVGDRVALAGDRERVERNARGRGGVDAGRVIDKVYRKTSDFNANSELKWLEILKTYQLYCYTRKNYKIIRNAGERDKHKTKVFTVSVHAV